MEKVKEVSEFTPEVDSIENVALGLSLHSRLGKDQGYVLNGISNLDSRLHVLLANKDKLCLKDCERCIEIVARLQKMLI